MRNAQAVYKLTDQLYDIDEAGIARQVLTRRQFAFEHLQNNIRNTVKYHFVTPRLYVPGMDALVKEVLEALTTKLGIAAVNVITYAELDAVVDTPRLRNVILHFAHSADDVKKLETPLFDVFVLLHADDLPQELKDQYLTEHIGRFIILTKRAEYQEKQ